MRLLLIPLLLASLLQGLRTFHWAAISTGVDARLRGVSAVSDAVVWASGTNGTVLRTTDSGATWTKHTIPGAETLDFRDIDAVDERTAYALSIGMGELSRIYKTADAGSTWTEQFVNRDPKAFFDAMAFWDAKRGVAVSDAVDGQFVILTTNDGGQSWVRVPTSGLPPALPNEGFFAASGTNVAVAAPNYVWVGTGAASHARVLRSSDGGRTWNVSTAPLDAGPSAGIFSIAFSDPQHGIVVGGDYKAETMSGNNAAVTTDGGATWMAVKGLSGFRSAVAYFPGNAASIVAVGPAGADVSTDRGRSWTPIAGLGFHAFSFLDAGRSDLALGRKAAPAGWSETETHPTRRPTAHHDDHDETMTTKVPSGILRELRNLRDGSPDRRDPRPVKRTATRVPLWSVSRAIRVHERRRRRQWLSA